MSIKIKVNIFKFKQYISKKIYKLLISINLQNNGIEKKLSIPLISFMYNVHNVQLFHKRNSSFPI